LITAKHIWVVMLKLLQLGSTGNVYVRTRLQCCPSQIDHAHASQTVLIGALPQCNCPDCLKGNVPCKHIIFVLYALPHAPAYRVVGSADIDYSLKVLKVPESSTTWYQKGLLVRRFLP
jgi:hypothetical protein